MCFALALNECINSFFKKEKKSLFLIRNPGEFHIQEQLFNCPLLWLTTSKRFSQALEPLYTYKTPWRVMQLYIQKVKLTISAKDFLRSGGGGHVSQLCMSEESAHVVKCSNLTLCPCRCTVCTFPVALLNGEDTTVRLKALILSSAKGTWIHRCTRER